MVYVEPPTRNRWAESVREMRAQVPQDQLARFIELRRMLILALQNAGAGLLLGSDAPQIMNVPGFSIHEELASMVAAGLTPLQALQSGTLNVASFFEESDRGQLAEGFRADFVLLAANPLEDISATRQVLGVARDGRWLGREALDLALEDIRVRHN